MPDRVGPIVHGTRALPPDDRSAQLESDRRDDLPLHNEVHAPLETDVESGDVLPGSNADATIARLAQTAPRSHSEQPGQQIGRYTLREALGEGGFGTVWAAEQREPVKRRVALKIIKLGMDTKQVIARFEAERQALAMMDHPNIAKVFDAGASGTGRPYFVMELVKGVPIVEYCDTEKLDTNARLNLHIQVCQAIQHAHQKGIIHRDIKPSNVLVTLHDGKPVPKVIDFGIAKATNQELTEKTLYTQHGQMIGTPAYMSPEQAEMSGLDIDTRSDIYSLGVLLYEILTGTTPFTNEELASAGFEGMMRMIREVEPHKPSTRLSSLGKTGSRTAQQRRVVDVARLGVLMCGDLDWIVMKCLEKDRTRRYETADGLAADIQRHLSDEPVTAGPPSARYKIAKFVKRNRGQVIGGGVLAAALVLGVMGTSWAMVWALREKDRADTETQRANASAHAESEQRRVAEANAARAIESGEHAERELARATEIKQLLTEMITSVSPEKARGADTTLLKGLLDDASKRLGNGEIADELVSAELHHVVGLVYWRLGLYPQAEAHLPIALAIRDRVLGKEHRSALSSMVATAILYSVQGRYAEAEPLLLDALQIRRRLLGDEHRDVLASVGNLALVYRGQGRSAEAASLLLEALAIWHRVHGAEHPDTLKAMDNLALLYVDQGRYAEAEPLMLEVLEIRKRVLGAEHPHTLASMSNLAILYANQGRHTEAAPLYVDSLEIEKRVLGDEHPQTLRSMNGLARLYSAQRRYAEAESLFVESLAIQKRVLGAEHPDALVSMSNLAVLYKDQGRYTEAESLQLESLATWKRVAGVEDRDTLVAMVNLAILYTAQGRYAEADALFLDSLKIQRRVLGEEHPNTLVTILNLGLLYDSMQRHEDAAALFETGVSIKRRALGMEHSWTRSAMRGLATAYGHLDRHDEALALHRELIALAPDDEELKATIAKLEAELTAEHLDTDAGMNGDGP